MPLEFSALLPWSAAEIVSVGIALSSGGLGVPFDDAMAYASVSLCWHNRVSVLPSYHPLINDHENLEQ